MDIPLPDALPERFHAAFLHVARDLHDDPEVLGAVCAGSPLRGEAGPNSDLDFFLIVKGTTRQRRTLIAEGEIVEIFRNPKARILRYFEENDLSAMDMLAYGHVVLDRDGTLRELRDLARRKLEAGPAALTKDQANWQRYRVWDSYLDVKDLLAATDPPAALGLMHKVVWEAIDCCYAINRRWLVKPKRMLNDLRAWDEPLAAMVTEFFQWGKGAARNAFALFEKIVAYTLAPMDIRKPMEWQSEPEECVDARLKAEG